jgi:hypothetical protein
VSRRDTLAVICVHRTPQQRGAADAGHAQPG